MKFKTKLMLISVIMTLSSTLTLRQELGHVKHHQSEFSNYFSVEHEEEECDGCKNKGKSHSSSQSGNSDKNKGKDGLSTTDASLHLSITDPTSNFGAKNMMKSGDSANYEGLLNFNYNEENIPENQSDTTLRRIQRILYKLAALKTKSFNPSARRKMFGNLSESYSKDLRTEARDIRGDKKKWAKIMAFPTALYRDCIFPYFKNNYSSFCIKTYPGNVVLQNACRSMQCAVCCESLDDQFLLTAKTTIVGHLLKFNTDSSSALIKSVVSHETIHKCKERCKEFHAFERPEILPTPKRDTLLGTEEKPAFTCMDIKQNGLSNARSGSYWLKPKGNDVMQAYCDMETDGGGWTLFFNYKHVGGAALHIDGGNIPNNLNMNSHIKLNSTGFLHRDVTEMRFFCTEKQKNNNKHYWSFKTSSSEAIRVARTGDQTSFASAKNGNPFLDSYEDVKPPLKIENSYDRIFSKRDVKSLNFWGRESVGGFYYTPFGSEAKAAYWTVIGDSQGQPRFECGSYHPSFGGAERGQGESVYHRTHHTIWFRGHPPSKEEVQARQANYVQDLESKRKRSNKD